jgi:hypothetical protein
LVEESPLGGTDLVIFSKTEGPLKHYFLGFPKTPRFIASRREFEIRTRLRAEYDEQQHVIYPTGTSVRSKHIPTLFLETWYHAIKHHL